MINAQNVNKIAEYDDKSLLLVDDDNPFRERLARAMEKKGFEVTQAESVQKGINAVKTKNNYCKQRKSYSEELKPMDARKNSTISKS